MQDGHMPPQVKLTLQTSV